MAFTATTACSNCGGPIWSSLRATCIRSDNGFFRVAPQHAKLPRMSSEAARNPRKFLVVVDKTPESKIAIRFATRRAQNTGGRVTLLCVAQAADFQQWRGVEEIMRDEAHQEAEALIYDAAKTVNELSGIVSELVIGEGRPMDV